MLKKSDAPFCEELYHVLLLSPKAFEHRLTFGSIPSGGNEHYIFNEDESLRETFCPTSTLLSIFKESHDLLAKYKSENLTDEDPSFLYLLTLGNLLATPGNHTALMLHERSFLERLGRSMIQESLVLLQNELLLVERLLTSTNNRLNKSSSLWYFYRKLLILATYHYCGDLHYRKTIIFSGSRHFSNYYCWGTARWIYDVIPAAEKADLLEAVSTFCSKNLSDISSWSALAYMVCQHKRKLEYNHKDYKQIKKLLNLPIDDNEVPSWPAPDVKWYVTKVVQSIDSAVADEWPPFLCLLTILNRIPEAVDYPVLRNWSDSVRSFEEKHGSIALLRNNPVVPPIFSCDALLNRSVRHYGWKKLFLLKIANR